jgi:hypothetical protein
MLRLLACAFGALLLAQPVAAEAPLFPSTFRQQDSKTEGATIHLRVGGAGPTVVLIHGFGDTGDMWAAGARSRA